MSSDEKSSAEASSGEMATPAVGNAYFYNMTNQEIELILNNALSATIIAAMPTTTPYTPNLSAAVPRFDGPPQTGQFGTTNALMYELSEQPGSKVSVTVDVNFVPYPIIFDILVYLFYNSVVVAVVSDGNAYMGKNGDVVKVDPTNSAQKI